jgi:transcriptional regulator with PAS, ATPase and Fis domain
MVNVKNTLVMATSLDKNETLENYYKNAMIAMKHRESDKVKRLETFPRLLNRISNELLGYYHEENCCSKLNFRHFKFQCQSHGEYVISSYHRCDYAHLGMEEVEQFVNFMAAHELHTCIDEHEACPIAYKYKIVRNTILDYFIAEFGENICIVDFDKRVIATQERTNIFQEEDDENIGFGMPMQPQEEENDEHLEKEERETPSSPSIYEVETQAQTITNDEPIYVDDILCFYDSDDGDEEYQPMLKDNIIHNI